ncbi:hypothetical protein [Streptomyces sp. MUSC 14]|uniref:hypothetical protein n=1 Tax=Streptomyces sp. MUSC 14 TaxID=1354889 RepID=UPI00210B4B65|nr:hypothetical protein [Streptomyces sp. MUSC 14]
MVFTPTALESEPARRLRWRGHFGVPGVFDGVHGFEPTPRDGGTHVLQSERFSGLLVPFSGAVITPSEKGFQALTDALRERVESASVPVRPRD